MKALAPGSHCRLFVAAKLAASVHTRTADGVGAPLALSCVFTTRAFTCVDCLFRILAFLVKTQAVRTS